MFGIGIHTGNKTRSSPVFQDLTGQHRVVNVALDVVIGAGPVRKVQRAPVGKCLGVLPGCLGSMQSLWCWCLKVPGRDVVPAARDLRLVKEAIGLPGVQVPPSMGVQVVGQ